MKLIKPSFEIIKPTGYTIDDIYKSIELAGKVCHKSENTIIEDSAKKFVDRMIKLGHGATLEFGTVYLKVPKYKIYRDGAFQFNEPTYYTRNLYYKTYCNNDYLYITTNYRYIIENKLEHWLQFLCEPTEYHEKRICVKFICDRGILAEFTRHRKFSFMAESTRYCNYSKGKFNNEITYICPYWLDYNKVQELTEIANKDNKEIYRMGHDESLSMKERGLCSFVYDMSNHEHGYLFQISAGWKPEQARAVLPNALKTELYMCGYVSDWEHFFELRDDKQHAHPQAYELAHPLHEEFIKRKYINETD